MVLIHSAQKLRVRNCGGQAAQGELLQLGLLLGVLGLTHLVLVLSFLAQLLAVGLQHGGAQRLVDVAQEALSRSLWPDDHRHEDGAFHRPIEVAGTQATEEVAQDGQRGDHHGALVPRIAAHEEVDEPRQARQRVQLLGHVLRRFRPFSVLAFAAQLCDYGLDVGGQAGAARRGNGTCHRLLPLLLTKPPRGDDLQYHRLREVADVAHLSRQPIEGRVPGSLGGLAIYAPSLQQALDDVAVRDALIVLHGGGVCGQRRSRCVGCGRRLCIARCCRRGCRIRGRGNTSA